MFLQLYSFWKLPITSSASRNLYKFSNKWCFQQKFKHLSLLKKWKAGRNSQGRIIIWTKTSLLIRQKSVKINYHLRYLRLGFIASFQLIPFKNKLLSLIYFANGSVTYYLTTEFHKIFSYYYLNFHRHLKKFFSKPTFGLLYQIKKLTHVSLLEITPGKGAQYCRSAGASARLIRFDKDTYSVLAQLPSGVKKIFSHFSFASIGKIAFRENKKFFNTKSGYWRSFGLKSIVRGVATNPIDHPHGGRTKAIKHQRTPWGKTTKLK